MPVNPLVSIITVCFNSDSTVENTIDSVLYQIYPNIEYIIIDGESTDNTIDIVKKYQDEISLLLENENHAIIEPGFANIKQVAQQIMEIV